MSLPVQWEELTASDFPTAVKRAEGVCVLPIGVIEKHGPHLPLGTDVMAAREASIGAARRDYAVVFPHYYFGQIYEARHQPGCITISPELLTALLQEICEEIGRNGFDKILIVNGHGGNTHWLGYFCQTQLARRRDYAVYIARNLMDPKMAEQVRKMRKTDWGGHADEGETSRIMAIRPDLVQPEKMGDESGLPQERLKDLKGAIAFSGISWYSDFPNHYAGDPAASKADLGALELEAAVRGLVEVIRAVKGDAVAGALQDEFYMRSEAPLKPFRRRSR
jgi:creatinine amidohydrolase